MDSTKMHFTTNIVGDAKGREDSLRWLVRFVHEETYLRSLLTWTVILASCVCPPVNRALHIRDRPWSLAVDVNVSVETVFHKVFPPTCVV